MMSRMTSHITKSFTPTLCIERGTMKITTIKLLAFALAITVGAGGALLLLPDHSHAAVTCPSTSTNDADGDGFTDAEECSGITLLDGVTVTSCVAGVDRNSCLDPNSKDVFVIVVPAAGSTLLGADPLRILKGTNVTGTKLGLAIHQITEGQTTDRRVNGSQNAIRITESLGTADEEETILRVWSQIADQSIDYGIMEHARDVMVIPASVGWSDVGDWAALLNILPRDEL